jgi:hypothetical protein
MGKKRMIKWRHGFAFFFLSIDNKNKFLKIKIIILIYFKIKGIFLNL